MAAILKARFERDQRIDWKNELLRRRTALQILLDAQKAADEALTGARAALELASANLQAWQEAQAAAKAAAEEEGIPQEEVSSRSSSRVY